MHTDILWLCVPQELLDAEAENAIPIEDEIEQERAKVDAHTPITHQVSHTHTPITHQVGITLTSLHLEPSVSESLGVA